jgi:hypothetical protein
MLVEHSGHVHVKKNLSFHITVPFRKLNILVICNGLQVFLRALQTSEHSVTHGTARAGPAWKGRRCGLRGGGEGGVPGPDRDPTRPETRIGP